MEPESPGLQDIGLSPTSRMYPLSIHNTKVLIYCYLKIEVKVIKCLTILFTPYLYLVLHPGAKITRRGVLWGSVLGILSTRQFLYQ